MTRAELVLGGLPLALVLALAVLLLGACVFWYRRDRGLVPRWVGRAATILRAAGVLLLLGLFLEIALRRVSPVEEPNELLLVFDGSRSMAARDEYRPGWQKLREAEALGWLPAGRRERTAERALAALPDLEKARIAAADREGIRRWAREHGVAGAEIEEAIGAVDAALARAGEAQKGGDPDSVGPGSVGPGSLGSSAAVEELAAALESLQRRLDDALLASKSEEVTSAVGRVEQLSRIDLARALLDAASGGGAPAPAGGQLARLAGRYRLSAAVLRSGAQDAAIGQDGNLAVFPTDAAWTDLGQPLLDVVLRRNRETLAGVVLVSDGHHNRGRRPEEVARSLAAQEVPVFTLGVGSEVAPPDARIVNVDAAGKVFAGDEIRADVAIESRGLGTLTLALRVTLDGQTVAETTVEAPSGGGVHHFPVAFQAPAGGASGPRRYTVSFPPPAGEVTAANDSRDFWVNVLTEKARVLLLDGGPRWEFRYLKSILGRDPNVELEAFLPTRPPDRRLPPGFPRDRESLFKLDVVILGDVEPALFGREELEALRDFVAARGASLVLIAGPRNLPDEYLGTPLEDLLPARPLEPRPPPGEGAARGRGGFRPRLTPEGERSPITRLVPGREPNRELWGLLPPMDWFAPVLSSRPQAEVLAALPEELLPPAGDEAPSPAAGALVSERAGERGVRGPLLATLSFGAGRVFYSGMDEVWKWRYRSGDQLLSRFWGQVIRWAASDRLPPGDEHVRLGTDELRYEPPAEIKLRALLTAPGGGPLEGAACEAVVRHVPSGEERRVRLEPIPQSGGLYRGTYRLVGGRLEGGRLETGAGALPAGEHRVHLEVPALPGYANRADKAHAVFFVDEPPSLEGEALTRDRALLAEMSRRAAPGGRYLPIERASELPDLLPYRRITKEKVTEIDQWVFAAPLLILFAALLTAEWIIRKRFDLA